jgi:hypothetical protein
MNIKRGLEALFFGRTLLLAIILSLTLLPVSSAHVEIENSIGSVQAVQMHELAADHVSEFSCEKHASGSEKYHKPGTESCCSSYCATFELIESKSIVAYQIARQKFQFLPGAKILAGEYPTPHRPPNA